MPAVTSRSHHAFVFTQAPEPHAARRLELLRRYPSIRYLYGHDVRTAWVTIAVVAAQFALAWQLRQVRGWWLLLASYTLGAPLSHWAAMAIHETSHRLAWPSRRGNVLLALFANMALVLPFAMTFHRYHLEHHRALGVRAGDTDLPLPLEARHIGNSRWGKLVWLFFHPLVYLLRGATFAKPPNRLELLNAAIILPLDLLIARLVGPQALAYLGLSFFFALGLHPVAAHFIHEHYTFAQGQETYSYYGPLNWLTFNVGYHNEHHDFAAVPGWRLPALRRLVPEYGRLVSHTSWTWVLWHFITNRRMGYASRIVRARVRGGAA